MHHQLYYDDRFKDCLKQVRATHPHLELSQIVIDDTVPPTLRGEDTVSDETINSAYMVEQEMEIDGMVITQPAPGGPDGLPTENPTTADDLPTVNPTVLDAPPS